MYNLERQLWYLHLLTRHCPYNLLPEPSSPKHEYRGKLWGQPVTSSMTSSPWIFFGIIWDDLFIAVFNISKFSKWPPFWARKKTFLLEVIPEVEYTRKMAMSISDILSFWSTLYLKYWRRYINLKMTSWICIYINVVIISRYLCTGRFVMISLLVCLFIMKNVVISFIKDYRGPTLRPPCDVIDDVIIMKKLFWEHLGRSFHIWG